MASSDYALPGPGPGPTETRDTKEPGRKPSYAITFETDELRQQATSEFVLNHREATLWENQKAEILVSACILIAVVLVLLWAVNYYKKRKSIIRYASGTSSGNANSQTTSNINSTSNMESHDGRHEKSGLGSPTTAISIDDAAKYH